MAFVSPFSEIATQPLLVNTTTDINAVVEATVQDISVNPSTTATDSESSDNPQQQTDEQEQENQGQLASGPFGLYSSDSAALLLNAQEESTATPLDLTVDIPAAEDGAEAVSAQTASTESDEEEDTNLDEADAAQEEDTPRGELTEEQHEELAELETRDQEVRQHEQAHVNAGRPFTGSPQYSFETGPDGRRYAVEGSVNIDASPIEGDPAATIEKARTVREAALAPVDPSAQDRRIAAEAAALEARARAELASEERDAQATERTEADDSDTQGVNAAADSDASDSADGDQSSEAPAGGSNEAGAAIRAAGATTSGQLDILA